MVSTKYLKLIFNTPIKSFILKIKKEIIKHMILETIINRYNKIDKRIKE